MSDPKHVSLEELRDVIAGFSDVEYYRDVYKRVLGVRTNTSDYYITLADLRGVPEDLKEFRDQFVSDCK